MTRAPIYFATDSCDWLLAVTLDRSAGIGLPSEDCGPSLSLPPRTFAERRVDTFQPPPRASIRSTVAAIRRPRIWTLATSLVRAMVWAVTTLR